MRVVVVGAGEVGFHLAQRLSEEHQDVVVVDSDPDRIEHAGQQLDIQTVEGNGASISVLKKAQVKDARMLMAVTSRDEVNIYIAAFEMAPGQKSADGDRQADLKQFEVALDRTEAART